MDTAHFSADDLKLLEYMLQAEGIDLEPNQAISPRDNTAEYPLSFAQERLWFLNQLEPESPAYNIPVALRLRGVLNIAALEQSFAALMQRHDVLRVAFTVVGGLPVQTLAPEAAVALPLIDLGDLAEAEYEQAIQRYAQAEAQQPFDLAHDPLVRLALLRLAADDHVLLMTQHHIVSDGWSTAIIVREIEALYQAYRAGSQALLALLPIQYADYAVWQRQWLQDDVLDAELRHWQQTLAGAPPVLTLPADRPRPSIKTYAGALHHFALSPALSDALAQISRQAQVTLFTALLSAFQVLLQRYTRQNDLVIGTPVANRTRAETHGLIGFFVNTLALRTDLSDNPSFQALLQRTHAVVVDSYAHQDLPFEKLVDVLHSERDLSYTPIFQILFQLDDAPPPITLPGLTVEYEQIERVTAKFDLSLAMMNTERGLAGTIEYSTDLFEAATIARLATHFQTLLAGIVAQPDRPILDLPLLTAAEQQALLDQWSATAQTFPQVACLHHRFQAQAARTPHAVAVVCDGQQLRYAELNARANQLAHALQRLGVGPDVLVGLYLERSADLVVALLAILKAGGAYLPLDPTFPRERLSAMLADARTPALITCAALADQLPAFAGQIIALDRDATTLAQQPTHDPISAVTPEHLAYVIYTSGSTGTPKGTQVTHANVTRLFDATAAWYHFDERDVWTLFHSIAFDFSVWELWGALLYGGRLVVVPYLTSRSPEAFRQLLSDAQVTVLNQTPSAFRQLMWAEQRAPAALPLALRYVIFGGEALDLHSLAPWFERHGDEQPQLVNMYGITETTVHVTYRPLSQADLHSAPGSVIGAPLPDLRLYVLDSRMEPVPLGVPGELYVGGAGVARGYLNRPALTPTRFLPDPFSVAGQLISGARLYRTGDLVRRLPDGDLEYLGRIDQQVKIRGFRIELGEIETALGAHPAVREAVVLARALDEGEQRLIAYIVPAPDDAPSAATLRSFLQTTLPDYMLPSAFVLLEAFPLTPTGKLDQRALPLPGTPSHEDLEERYVAARTPDEQALAEIWAKALHLERVGVEDNFFALGGDSILSVRVLALARERGLKIELQDLFRYQTIAALSAKLQPTAAAEPSAPPSLPFSLISAADRQKLPLDADDAYPLTRLQAGMIYHMELGSGVLDYHNVTSFHLRGLIEIALFRIAAEQIVQRHPALRTSFDLVRYSEPLQLVHSAATLEITEHDLRDLTQDEQEQLIGAFVDAELRRPFDLMCPGLMRLHFHRRSDDAVQFTITEFHPILDGWSLNTVLAEMFEAYLALLDNVEPDHAPPASTFRDFVQLERQALQSADNQRFWQAQLQDATLLDLPRWFDADDRPREVRSIKYQLSDELSAAAQQLAQRAGVPLKSVLLAAHLRVMSLLSPQADVLTGIVTHGRSEERDGENVCGLFLNSLPFRMKPTSGTWLDLIRATFEVELELVPFRRYPLAALQQQWGQDQPLFQALFNFTNFHVLDELVLSQRIELLPTSVAGLTSSNIPLQVAFGFNSGSSRIEHMIDYHTSVICAEQAQEIADYYITVLTAMTQSPQSRYEIADILSDREKHELLVARNATATLYPEDRTVAALVSAQAARTPDAVAVVCGPATLSYAALDARAAQLARALQQRGVRPGDRVALCLERAPELVIAILAIWHAGAAFVPLDPAFPPARLAFLLADSHAVLLLTQQRLLPRFPAAPPRLLLDADAPALAALPATPLPPSATADYLAYLIYTSGSTGQPKGVLVAQRALLNYLHWAVPAYTAAAGCGAPVQSSIAADAIFPSLFCPLLVGAAVQLLPEQDALPALAQQLAARPGFSLIKITPTQLDVLSALLPDAVLAGATHTLVVGAEALRGEQVQRWQQHAPATVIRNEYGPTETVVGCSSYVLHPATLIPGPVPIGWPIANTQFYVLDAHGQPAPIGVLGELYIGGAGVAWGYHRQPALTAAAFVPDPFSAEPGARLYRTGDRVRALADTQANITFVGRDDDQVKIRGYRVELAEVAAALAAHPAVQEVAVVARTDDGRTRLVAYVVARADAPLPSSAALRTWVAARLPAYMAPETLVELAALPLTATGKLDRRALPEPGQARPTLEQSYVAPQTAAEELLATIWAEVLHLERLGRHDNFFALGGHSLLAIQVIARVRQIFQIDLPLRALFNAPSVADLAMVVTAAQQQTPTEPPPALLPAARDAALPLSFAQQRLWFLDQLQPGSLAYTIPLALHLSGLLDIPALQQSFATIVARHEVLRTTFTLHDDQPVQLIHPANPAATWLQTFDLRLEPQAARSAAVQQQIDALIGRSFDLQTGPLLRAVLLRLDDDAHMLLLAMHHIISDGWSQSVLFRELGALYNATVTGRIVTLPPLPVQYADYAVWQRAWLTPGASVLTTQLDYWRAQLADAPPLELPTDYPRPAAVSFRGDLHTFVVSTEVSAALRALSRQEGVTLFMTLLAAFQTLLARYSGQTDLTIGTPIAGRAQRDVEGLLGLFINTLALRTTLDDGPSFRALLQRVREVCLGAYAHQDTPFEQLVEELQPERDLSRNPIFQVMFTLQNQELDQATLQGLTIEPLDMPTQVVKFDLDLGIRERDGQLIGTLGYSTDLFAATTIARLAAHFQTLLAALTAAPDQSVATVAFLSAVERQTLLVDWNATHADYPSDQPIHQLFEAQVVRTPDALAVSSERERLSYAELNARANQLAHVLQRLGVGPDVLVGLCLERSSAMVIALLAVLKAGGAYLPIDPAYPLDRMRFMLTDSRVQLVLSAAHLGDRLPTEPARLLFVDGIADALAQEPATNPPIVVQPANLAYVIYTSGSTGRPKGALIPHRGMVNYLSWCVEAYGLAAGSGAPVQASLAFDLTVTALFAPLLAGRTAHLLAETHGIEALGAALRDQQGFSLVKITPAHLEALSQNLAVHEACGATQRFVIGGEQLLAADLAFWQEHAPDTLLINEYGPTETVVGCCVYSVPRTAHVSGSIPIGRPIANTQLYILDDAMQPVPVGVAGELYIGGDGLARGYLNRPGLTAEKFTPHLFSEHPGERLYRTGDLARFLPDGNLVFLGRRDDQVKLRGYRIELGEIEAALRQHPAIQDSVVLLREVVAADKQLVAYLVPAPEQTLALDELRDFLGQTLPPYMLPTRWMLLEAVPLTTNGKVDRKALPMPDEAQSQLVAGYVAPCTPTEEIVAALWAEALHLEQVSASANFFALGGHSLLATQLVARLRSVLRVELPLRAVFETPTLAALAAHLDALRRRPAAPLAPPIPAVARDAALPLSFAQQRLWFLHQLQPDSASYTIPLAVALHGPLDLAALQHSLAGLVRRHEMLRTTFRATDAQPVQHIQPPDARPPQLQLLDLQAQPATAPARLAALVALPFDLATGPLLRVTLLRLPHDTHILLLALHHIIIDGWSLDRLLAELGQRYTAATLGQPLTLPPLPLQYADYAVWQRAWLQGPVLATQLDYWRTQLAATPPLALSSDHRRPAVLQGRGATVTFALDAALRDALHTLSRQAGVTLFMTLLAAFQTLLARASGQDDIAVGTPIAGRTRGETEALLGLFVNTLVLRTAFADAPSFRTLLARVREVCLGAYAHQDLPFEQVVEALQPARDLSRNPLFQAMFTLSAPTTTALALPGLTVTPLALGQETAKFDLSLRIAETETGLLGALEYSTELFLPATAARLVAHFQALVAALVAAPDQPVTTISFLSAAERQQQLVDWNSTYVASGEQCGLHQLFEAQAARTPDAIAVVCGAQALSYADLNCRANQLARRLRRDGVGPNTIVGICLDRSLDLVMALLAVLKAGGAYLPLDPTYPAERLQFMLEDAGVSVLLTQQHSNSSLTGVIEGYAAHGAIVRLDADWPMIAQEQSVNLPTMTDPAHLAYVIYTSGSTGKPKGAAVDHRGIVNLVRWYIRELPLGKQDRVLLVSAISFDLTQKNIFAPLSTGDQLHLLATPFYDSTRIRRTIAESGITLINCTPSAFYPLVEDFAAGDQAALASLRYVVLGGEPIALARLQAWTASPHCHAELLNTYGPTECSDTAAYARMRLTADLPDQTMPLGRPIANVQLFVLDAHGELLPAGAPGELSIGGIGVGQGYLNRPALTAEKFAPNPFALGDIEDARLYRTGDLVRYRADGQLEFLGRIDQQVKLRGYRIELGEIEAALRRHPAVREAIAMVREDTPGNQQLVAYIVRDTLDASAADGFDTTLATFVRQFVPEYMAPTAFVTLTELPLTPSGKLNRDGLPAPQIDPAVADRAYSAPRTPAEEVLATIWADLFALPRVSTHANFFALGGHSLLATRVISRIRVLLQVELPLRAVFEAPTVAELAALVESSWHDAQGTPERITRRDVDLDDAPLSFAQQRLWFLHQLQPDSASYTIPLAVALHGPLDLAALQHSLAGLVRRHEMLRTTFRATDAQPVQHIQPPDTCPPQLQLLDLQAQPATAPARLAALVAQPFDLATGPLLRVTLLRLHDDTHILLLALHHIIIDGWSLDRLLAELGQRYTAATLGQPLTLPPLPLQYADYAVWQRAWLQGPVLTTQLDYWRTQLAATPPLALPSDHRRPAVLQGHGATVTFALDAALLDALHTLSRQAGVTLFMTLLAAFQTLLARASGQDDIAVGTPIAGRTRGETEALLGLFVNTLVLRTAFADAPSFRTLLARVREVCLGAYAHQDLPFEQVVEALQPARDLSRNPLFQVMFALQTEPGADLVLPGLTVTPLALGQETAKFDLSLGLTETADGLLGALEYSTELFLPATAARLAAHFQTLLAALVAAPDQPVMTISFLSAAEQQQLLAWNATTVVHADNRPIHQQIAQQAARTPDAIAVSWGDQRLSYGELDRRANQLAHYLQQLGVGPEALVGVCLPRTAELIVTLLAVLKAGGAYLPLDPAYPPERLQFMLDDARATVLVTTEELSAIIPAPHTGVVCLDARHATIARYPVTEPSGNVLPEHPAYIIYTSGSTGRPKGVVVSHSALANYISTAAEMYDLRPADRVLQFSSFSFDASAEEIYPCLTRGSTLVLRTDEMLDSLTTFLQRSREWELTVLNVPTAYWHELVRTLDDADDSLSLTVRLVVIGGEAALSEQLARWQQKVDASVRLVNTYGPTETTIVACQYTTNAVAASCLGPVVPIGRPVANTQVYVLDADLNPAPVGVPGELYIGGAGVTRGYLNQPALTAERFVPDPFGADSAGAEGLRLYRSGDRARYRADGQLEFLGRIDQQVKLRGYRIELGEIEAALRRHPAVREAVVAAREDSPGRQRLVAYVVLHAQQTTLAQELRQALMVSLPEYMLPSVFVILPQLPLTPSGKLDRRALPAPDTTRNDRDHAYVAPCTPTEEIVAALWAEALHLEQVSASANFFALGGHSLLATQLVARLRSVLRVELPLRAVFETPTLAALAAHLDALRRRPAAPLAPPIPPAARDAALPLSFAQQRLWFLHQLQPDSASYTIPLAVALHGPLDLAALQHSLAGLVRRHEMLRTTFRATDAQPVQHIQPPDAPHPQLQLLDLQAQPATAPARLAALVAQPFDLATGPLLRVTLLRLHDDTHILLLALHHIIIDGWSLDRLLAELGQRYTAATLGQPLTLPPLPLQYADYAVWQRAWLQGPVLTTQLDYWRTQLAATPPLALPSDHRRPAVLQGHGATVTFALDAALLDALHTLSRQAGVTLFMTLLAAFQTLLARASGQDDIAVGTPIAGRTRGETEALLGLFVNTLVLRTTFADAPSFRTLLQRVREVCLGAYAHQDLPFEQVVEALQPARDLSRNPLFQAMFTLSAPATTALALPGLTVTPLALGQETAKFDLSLGLAETADGLLGALEYSTELFLPATAARLVGHFQTLLAALVAAPDQPVTTLPLLSPIEQQQLLAWNATTATYPAACLHELVTAQAARTPDAIAVMDAEQTLSYGELDRRANQLAHELQRLGVQPEAFVGVCLERSLELVVALLAVLKAGGAYVPLDPAYPPERLQFMLEDADVAVLLTQQDTLSALGDTVQMRRAVVVNLDSDWAAIARQPMTAPQSGLTNDHPAYVIYTSGSTGRPKGVVVTHRAIVNHMDWMQMTFPLTAADRVVQKTPFSFDASVWEFYAPLLAGAQLVMARPGGHQDPAYLAELIQTMQATVLQMVPSLLRLLLEEPQRGRCTSLRRLFCGGEALPADLVALAQAQLPATIINLYGPTEATIDTTFWVCAHLDDPATPIGRPIANMQTYVLDAALQPVPVGVAGELYIGGDGLARGYLNQPALTAERFVANPFGADSPLGAGSRLYRTGDRARYRADGALEYLGRLDQQVKLRGFRIELGEIEAALRRHPAVRDSLVLIHEAPPHDQQLIAYLALMPDTALAPGEARTFVRAQLPEYMTPNSFVMLDAFPMLPNGKVDRRALTQMVSAARDGAPQHTAAALHPPRDILELQLCQIWEEALNVRPIGVRDNFFDLGGHSILAVRLMSQIRQQLGQQLPLAALFQGATVGQLASLLRQTSSGADGSPLVAIQPHGSKRPFFCVHPVGGNVLCYVELARQLGLDQPLYGLQATGGTGADGSEVRIETMAARYIAALREIQPHGPYQLGGWSMGGVIAFEMAQQLQAHDEQVALVALIDSSVTAPDQATPIDQLAILGDFAHDLGLPLAAPANRDEALRSSLDQQLHYILEQAQQADIIPAGAAVRDIRQLFETYAANVRALAQYVAAPYHGHLTLLVATQEADEAVDDVAPAWSAVAAEGITIHTIVADHYSILRRPGVAELAERLRLDIAQLLEPASRV